MEGQGIVGEVGASYVYHMTGGEHGDLSEGYIGVTNNMVKRKSMHRRRPRNDKIKQHLSSGGKLYFNVIYEGDRESCLLVEAMLRPLPGIGWNEKSGGDVKTKHSEQSNTKNRLNKLGNGNVGKGEDHHFFGKTGQQSVRFGTRGELSPMHKGWWITPQGRFGSQSLAAEANCIGKDALRYRCLSIKSYPEWKFQPNEDLRQIMSEREVEFHDHHKDRTKQ